MLPSLTTTLMNSTDWLRISSVYSVYLEINIDTNSIDDRLQVVWMLSCLYHHKRADILNVSIYLALLSLVLSVRQLLFMHEQEIRLFYRI